MKRTIRKSRRLRAALGGVLGAGLLIGGAGVNEAEAVTFIKSDLDFILQQIKISENHAAGNPLVGTGPLQISNPNLMYGLRTVDGSDNNIQPNQAAFGAADQAFPRLTSALFRDAEDFNLFGPGGTGPSQPGGTPTSYLSKKGFVEDSQPRVISNLVADASSNNPAAVAAADQKPGSVNVDDGHPANPDPFFIPNTATDAGLSAPYNSWFTFFGQFFDHGLDLVNKGKSGTVLMPLKDDDPLIAGRDGIRNDDPLTTVDEGADDLPANMRFMTLSRATNQPGPDGRVGDNPATPDTDESADDIHEATNQTTPFVDQNQTYTSHPSHQVFHRAYVLNAAGKPVATGKLLDGATGGLANWAEVKAQAQTMLGIALDDHDVLDVPLLLTDKYGHFIPDPDTGFAQIVTNAGNPPMVPPTVASGTPGAPVDATLAVRTGHAFLDDIAHNAGPKGKSADTDAALGLANDPVTPTTGNYDNELLDSHFVTGDGRGNENIGLTTVHHVFHSEHNRLADHIKDVVLATATAGDFTFLNQWLITAVDAVPADLDTLVWNGERIFQAAKFGTEMQYQHLVFEEFARKMQPLVNVFAGYQTEINPAIVAEFAHTVYRFGHSMLTETVPRTNPDGTPNDIGLIQAFLNPQEFNASGANAKAAAGAIVQGTTRQVGNELDEFVTDALRDNLLGLPLDLPAINLARGRDTGIPPLNQVRKELFASTSHAALEPYTSWADFGLNLRHPESLVNFIAAYGKHPNITGAVTQADKRIAANAIVNGGAGAPVDRGAFLNSTNSSAVAGDPGNWANGADGNSITGLDSVDLWIGGLAEKQMPFGGLLGSTFNFVFETQMENLQDGDRFYYLGRLAGLHFLTELEGNSFAALIARNTTGTKYLPADVFSRPDYVIEMSDDGNPNPTWFDGARQLASIAVPGGPLRFKGGEHVVMGGTEGGDNLRSNEGDDTLHGLGGDDRLEGEAGNDVHLGGEGDDIITDTFGDDNFKGGPGNDAISVGGGIDLALAGPGDDMVVQGEDVSETFGGPGDDLITGGQDANTIFANEGDDWLEGGDAADLMQGGNGDPFQTDTQTGHDVIVGEGGNDDYDSEGGDDDIMVTGPGIERNEGMLGFDWVTHRLDPQAARADMNFTGLMPPDIDAIRDRFDMVEGLSGWTKDDILRGDSLTAVDMGTAHSLNNATQINRIAGLQDVLGAGVTSFTGGNIILGGSGSDLIEGRGGNDLIDGDKQLNVQLEAPDPATPDLADKKLVNLASQLQADIFARKYTAGQVDIVRSIETPAPVVGAPEAIDTAVFSDVLTNYQVIENPDDPTMITVIHLAGAGIDGTDTLHNIERLQFSDQTVVRTGTNPVPTGVPTIDDATPTEDQVLIADLGTVADLNGINPATIAFEWQAETDPNVWTTVGIGTSFTPGDGEVGLRLRTVVSFQDGLGVFENAVSVPTAAVVNINDVPTGRPAINDLTPQIDQTLTASRGSIADNDGLVAATFTFQWQSKSPADPETAWVDLGAPSPTVNVPAGQMVRVIASFTDDNGTNETATSVPTAPAPDAVPPLPVEPATSNSTETGLRLLSLSRLRVTQPTAAIASISVHLSAPASLQLQVRRTNNNKLVRRVWGKADKAGVTTLRWNKRDANGKRVKAGNYRFIIIAKSVTGEQKIIRKIVRVR